MTANIQVLPDHIQNLVIDDCKIESRCLDGPCAREYFVCCAAPTALASVEAQANAVYGAVLKLLASQTEASSVKPVLCYETLYLRDVNDIAPVRSIRERALRAMTNAHSQSAGENFLHHACIEIGQPPLPTNASLSLQLHFLVPANDNTAAPASVRQVTAETSCNCAECRLISALQINISADTRLYSGAIYGSGSDAFEQTANMFSNAEQLLQRAGMGFSNVVRTWIYLREMQRDYDSLNRARREFFQSRNIAVPPASTGIGAQLVPGQHDIALAFYAVKGKQSIEHHQMQTPTLNEAPSYGADFSRGMRVAESSREAFFVSGTASLDESGRSIHDGDIDAQARRMVLNIRELLRAQGADTGDIVSATTYIKHAKDASRVQEVLQREAFAGFPNALVHAEVCRPELLCECEVLAIRPVSQKQG